MEQGTALGHAHTGALGRYLSLGALALAVLAVSSGGASMTVRGLAGVGHYDTFDLEIGPIWELKFSPTPDRTYTQLIDANDLDAYRSWRGLIEVRANFDDCVDGSNDCYHRTMTVEDWRPIDQEVTEWKQLNRN